MKTTSKTLAVIALVLLLGLALRPAHAAETLHSGACGEYAWWTLDSDGLLTVSGYGTVTDSPWDRWKDDIVSLAVNSSIITLDDFVFAGLDRLKVVTLADTVKSINEGVFMDCTALEYVTLPYGLTTIGGNVFNGCTSLRHVSIPDSVTEIGNAVFSGSGIVSVSLPSNITKISSFMFYNCDNLKSFTVPYGVTRLMCDCFDGCDSLEAVDIPTSVTHIEDHVFCNCPSLKSVYISANVKTIEEGNFVNCDSLTVTVSGSNPNYSSDSRGVFFNKSKSTLIQAPGGLLGWYTIPDSVTTLNEGAFSPCKRLSGVTIPGSITTISGSCFYGCENLTYVELPRSVKTISYGAFGECKSLKTIDIPNGVRTIGDGAFWESGLETVWIPSSVTSIGEVAFYNCKNLTAIHCYDNNTKYWSDGVSLYNAARTTLMQAPAGLTGTYVVRSSVTAVPYGAFGGCDKLTAIYFRGNAPAFDEYSFDGVSAAVLYPQNNSSWTGSKMQDYGGSILWRSYDPKGSIVDRPMGDIDCNFEITNSDLVTLARYTVGAYEEDSPVSRSVRSIADINGDRMIDNGDLVMLARIVVGL